ncbi:MAG: hypothetical protein ACK4ZJ_19225, partial [Allorhizobium sp.]
SWGGYRMGTQPEALARLAGFAAPVRADILAACGLRRLLECRYVGMDARRQPYVRETVLEAGPPPPASLADMRSRWSEAQRWNYVLDRCALLHDTTADGRVQGMRRQVRVFIEEQVKAIVGMPLRATVHRRLVLLATLQLWMACIVAGASAEAAAPAAAAAAAAAALPHFRLAPYELLAALVAMAAALGASERADEAVARQRGAA